MVTTINGTFLHFSLRKHSLLRGVFGASLTTGCFPLKNACHGSLFGSTEGKTVCTSGLNKTILESRSVTSSRHGVDVFGISEKE